MSNSSGRLQDESPLLVLIAGGSGSGKSTITRNIVGDRDDILHLPMDDFFGPYGDLSRQEMREKNFDHPDEINWDVLTTTINTLITGHSIEKPVYSFEDGTWDFEEVKPHDAIILEGIHALWDNTFVDMADLSVFMDTLTEIRFRRRVERDTEERGVTVEETLNEFVEQAMPMHREYIEPQKRRADVVIPDRGTDASVDVLRSFVEAELE